jgi:hypothetical protein
VWSRRDHVSSAGGRLRRGWTAFLDILNSDKSPDDVVYDPVHVAGTVMVCLAGLGAIYWVLWSFLVFEGGVFPKAGALLNVLLTAKTFRDFGFEGHPDRLGAFEGWIVNVAGLLIFLGVGLAAQRLFRQPPPKKKAR